jgi:hypothetical protein
VGGRLVYAAPPTLGTSWVPGGLFVHTVPRGGLQNVTSTRRFRARAAALRP